METNNMTKRLRDWIQEELDSGTPMEELKSYYKYQDFTGLTGDSMQYSSYERRLRSFKNTDRVYDPQDAGQSDVLDESEQSSEDSMEMFKDTLQEDARMLHIRSATIRTVEDLLDFADIDTDEWEVVNKEANVWGGADSGFYQVKAKLKKRKPEDLTPEDYAKIFDDLVSEFKDKFPKTKFKPKWRFTKRGSNNALEIALVDHHFDLHSFRDIRSAEERIGCFIATVQEIIRKAKPYGIQKVFFIVGHDFFNSDTYDMTTTKGTKQHDILGYKQSFKIGVRCLIATIEELLKTAPVEVVMVPGNHDTMKAFYLGAVLSAFYAKHKYVTVNNGDRDLKYFRWGKCFVGLTHKENRRGMNLPLILSRKFKEIWGEIEYIEVHKGHVHKERVKEYISIDEETTIKVRNLPSLSLPSEWEDFMGYMHLRQTQAFVWNDETGLDAILHVHPKSVEKQMIDFPVDVSAIDMYGQEAEVA